MPGGAVRLHLFLAMSRVILFVVLLLSMPIHAQAENSVNLERPVVLTTDEILEEARRKVAANHGPAAKAWGKTLERAKLALTKEFVPYQESEYLRYYRTGRDQAQFIRDLAIVHRVTGEPRYAERGREILLDWARDFQRHYDFPRQYPASEIPHASGLVIGRTVTIFADAYALLWPELSPREREEIEHWFRSLLAPIKESLRLWEVGEYQGMKPPYFGRQYFNNHLGACNMGIAAIGFALRDPNVIDYVMKPAPSLPDRVPGEVERSNPRDLHVLLNGVILMPGDFGSGEEGDVLQGRPGDPSRAGYPAPLAGETWDRYRVTQGKGMHYSLLHLRLLTLMAEMARNNLGKAHYTGPDIFEIVGRRGENLAVSYEVYADWFITMDPAAVNNGYYVDAVREGLPRPTVESNLDALSLYELAGRRYPRSEPIREALRVREEAGDRPAFDPETFAWTATLLYAEETQGGEFLRAGERTFQLGETIYREDFDSGSSSIWVEGNPDRVKVENGRLIMDSNSPDDRVSTVFVDREFENELYFEYEAEILASDTAAGFPEPRNVNNLNTFLYYSDPAGRDLRATKDERADGAYRHYHELRGYIVTFLNGHIAELREKALNPEHAVTVEENTGRIRLRENPGFVLKNEAFAEESVGGRVYRMQFVFAGGELFFFIDGRFQLSFRPSPDKRVERGYFAFRTFSTKIAVDRFVVRKVSVEENAR